MIGNDVIDLKLAAVESNWKRRGFLEKLFTPNEQHQIETYPDPELLIWIFWSMKESAYKIFNRQSGVRALIPHQFDCTVQERNKNITGSILGYGTTYHSATNLGDTGMLHTIATTEKYIFKYITEIDAKDTLKDNNGLPCYYLAGTRYLASLSHHGRFVKAVAMIESNPVVAENIKKEPLY